MKTDLKFIRQNIVNSAACIMALLAHGCTTLHRNAEQNSPEILAINASMKDYVTAKKTSGVVTLVGQKGKIVHLGAVGKADIEGGRSMKTSDVFSIASMTKPITATAVMMLQDEGKLHINDPVSKYIPEFGDMKLRSGENLNRPITIRDCMTHTSGLTGDQVFPGTLKEAVIEHATRKLAFQPNEKWQYSPGMNVCGRVVEIVSGMSIEAFFQKRIFGPLEMKDTTFVPDTSQQKRIASLYAPSEDEKSLVAVDNRISNFSDVKGQNPSGGLVSTASDMFRFYQMILNGGELRGERIVSENSVRQMTSPQTGDLKTGFTPGNCWGLGWCIVREPQGVSGMLSSGTYGHGGAFGTQGWVDPETETIYVLMIQRTRFGNSDGSDIRKDFQQAAVDALGF